MAVWENLPVEEPLDRQIAAAIIVVADNQNGSSKVIANKQNSRR